MAKAQRENDGAGKACEPIQPKLSVHHGACEPGKAGGDGKCSQE